MAKEKALEINNGLSSLSNEIFNQSIFLVIPSAFNVYINT
jgi:hypothetical protein